jgi:hypothetical protein
MTKSVRLFWLFALIVCLLGLGVLAISDAKMQGWSVTLLCGGGALLAAAFLRPDISGFGRTGTQPAASILTQFPRPVTLTPSRRKWSIMLVFSLAIAMSLWLALQHPLSIRQEPFVVWMILVFAGFGIIVSTLMLLPHANVLILDEDGFELIKFFRRKYVPWKDASHFEISHLSHGGMVIFDNAQEKKSHLARVNTWIGVRNSGLPDTYGLSAENMASLMNQWRERALQSKS